MEPALPLPPYEFDPSLSEDENFLTWCCILARHSFSKKGHMAAIVVAPPAPASVPSASTSASASDSTAFPSLSPAERILQYANNTPLLFHRSPKNVPEIHAEALCISRAARRGIALEGATIYVTFPPCNECFKLIAATGVRRAVFRKGIWKGVGDALLVAARVCEVQMEGTSMRRSRVRREGKRALEQGEQEQGEQGEQEKEEEWEEDHRPDSLIKAEEKRTDAAREKRVKAFWETQGETAQHTRSRVEEWWKRWMGRYKEAARELKVEVEVEVEIGNEEGGKGKGKGKEKEGKKGRMGKGNGDAEEVHGDEEEQGEMDIDEDELKNAVKEIPPNGTNTNLNVAPDTQTKTSSTSNVENAHATAQSQTQPVSLAPAKRPSSDLSEGLSSTDRTDGSAADGQDAGRQGAKAARVVEHLDGSNGTTARDLDNGA